VKIYNPSTLELVNSLRVNLLKLTSKENISDRNPVDEGVECLATLYNEEQNALVGLTSDNTISVWDVESFQSLKGPKVIQKWICFQSQRGAGWSPSTKCLFTFCGNYVSVWEFDNVHYKDRMVGHTEPILCLLVLEHYEFVITGGKCVN
jgi:WD40 repeat protein